MSRALLVHRTRQQGSRYKYPEMFSQVCDMAHAHVLRDKIAPYCDFGIVFGDIKPEWRRFKWRGIPYILIENDVGTWRGNGDPDDEREMIESAACILVASEEFTPYLQERYECPTIRTAHLKPMLRDLDFEPLPKRPKTIGYAGGLQCASLKDSPVGYRAYHDIFSLLIEAGWEIHLYPGWYLWAEREREYADLGCVIHQPVPDGIELHREMSQYTLSFHGYGLTGCQDYVKACRPNKTWLGLASGIPTIGFNTGRSGDIYDGKWGLVAPSLAELPATAERAALMEIPESLRLEQTIDTDIDVFAELVRIAAGE